MRNASRTFRKSAIAGLLIAGCVAAATGWIRAGSPVVWVVSAPGFPSDTEQAQPTMDRFAAAVARAAGWPPGSLRAVYDSSVEGGIEKLQAADTAVALVPAALWLEHGDDLGLEPLVEAVPAYAERDRWELVAARGSLRDPKDLEGWRIVSRAGYAPEFVRGVLRPWGVLPPGARIEFSSRVVSALRQAAAGQPVAVLLDAEQGGAWKSLPFAKDLEAVYRSEPLPASLVCEVRGRLGPERREALVRTLLRLHRHAEGRQVLEEIRIRRFQPAAPDTLSSLRARLGPGNRGS